MSFRVIGRGIALSVFALALMGGAPARGGDPDLQELRNEMRELRNELHRTLSEKQKRIEELERQVQSLQTTSKPAEQAKSADAGPGPSTSGQSALEKALSGIEQYQEQTRKGELASRPLGGGATVRLMDISLDVLFNAGSSTEGDKQIELLQGGGHDPHRRGFTLSQAEIGLVGAIDPYFTAESYIVFTEEGVELEEAYFKSSSLPAGLQLKGGFFLTEFGIINQTHPHSWDWIDQPIINTRLFGGDGTRGPGARLSWLTPLPWYSEIYVGMQNANNETMVSFLGSRENVGVDVPSGAITIGGRPLEEREVTRMGDFLYLARWENSFDLSKEVTTKFGFSGLFGPNNTGADGYTTIYGADMKMKWRPVSNEKGWPFLVWQSEIMARDYRADTIRVDGSPSVMLPEATLHDWGVYTQLLYGFHPHWSAGLRFEYASGDEASKLVFDSRAQDPFRDNRYRVSPILTWYSSEFMRFRLQYNYDLPDHLDREAHSIWLGTEFLIGAHPAHKY
ncbi:MAG: hypothetical protein WAW37_10680 [Syntrophobacteraceae bacterium]